MPVITTHGQHILQIMLNKIIRFSIKQKLIIGMMTLALIIWGVWSARQLPVDAVPDITNNQVQIITVTPTLAAQETEQLVTYPIEQSLANLPGRNAIHFAVRPVCDHGGFRRCDRHLFCPPTDQ